MNFLAHLTLSHFSADLQVGNFLGDFIRGRGALVRLPEEVQRGVAFHRAIDSLTDADESVRALNRLLAKRHGRYAGVVSDIAFDYVLFQNWERFGPAPFPDFTRTTYAHLAAARPLMTSRVAGYVTNMVADDWLRLYTTPAGMRKVFARLLPRLSRPELLDGIDETLTFHAPDFNRAFTQLFPRLQTLADAYRPPPPARTA